MTIHTNTPETEKVFMFTGQGNQYPEMFEDWYGYSDTTDSLLRIFHNVTETKYGEPLPAELLETGPLMQPANVVAGLLGLAALKAEGVEPNRAIGHSLGEISAAVAAGSLASEDAIWLAHKRGIDTASAIEKLKIFGIETGMAAFVARKGHSIGEYLAHVLPRHGNRGETAAANDNHPGQIVVSGLMRHIRPAIEKSKGGIEGIVDKGIIRAKRLAVDGAYHTPNMLSAKKRFARSLNMVEISDPNPNVELFSPTVIGRLENLHSVRTALASQLILPVEFKKTIKYCLDSEEFIELGAKPQRAEDIHKGTLIGLMRENAEHQEVDVNGSDCYRISTPDDLREYLSNF